VWLFNSAKELSAAKGLKSPKYASIVFQGLYDEDIVDEESFLKWKDDTRLSSEVEGKSDALLGAGVFFNWLATAEEGDDADA
jgi:eIF4-gamma/eIF5/eIF2-epsilon